MDWLLEYTVINSCDVIRNSLSIFSIIIPIITTCAFIYYYTCNVLIFATKPFYTSKHVKIYTNYRWLIAICLSLSAVHPINYARCSCAVVFTLVWYRSFGHIGQSCFTSIDATLGINCCSSIWRQSTSNHTDDKRRPVHIRTSLVEWVWSTFNDRMQIQCNYENICNMCFIYLSNILLPDRQYHPVIP